MDYLVVIGIFAVSALILLMLALWLGWPGRWILRWLQGSLVLALLASSVLLAVIAADLPHWSKVVPSDEQAIVAHIGVEAATANTDIRILSLSLPGQSVSRSSPDLQGDFAHLGFQVLRWRGPLHLLGLSYRPLYVRTGMDNLHARTEIATEETRQAWQQREQGWFDVWNLLQHQPLKNLLSPIVQADTLELGYIPLTAKSTLFSVSLQKARLTLLPINESARQALTF